MSIEGAAVYQLVHCYVQQVWQQIVSTLKHVQKGAVGQGGHHRCAEAASTSPAPAACRSSAVT